MKGEQEQADRIIEMYLTNIQETDFHVPEFITGIEMANGSKEYKDILDREEYEHAKQCALIHINGIIEATKKKKYKLTFVGNVEDGKGFTYIYSEYWQKVKSIIESK